MKVRVDKLQDIVKNFFDGNQKKCAEKLHISREYLNQILKSKEDIKSPKLCNSIILFCKKNNLNEEDYIFLD